MLPLHGKVLVGPGDIDLMGAQVGAVFANHGDVQSESATHGFIHRLTDCQLGEATFSPETLQDLAAMLDLNKGAGLIVAAPPEGGEFFTRFHGPGF